MHGCELVVITPHGVWPDNLCMHAYSGPLHQVYIAAILYAVLGMDVGG